VIPSSFKWVDIGSFDSIASLLKGNKDGNIILGNHIGIDTKDCILFSDNDILVSTIGIKDLTVIATADAVLVCDKERTGNIRQLIKKIRKEKRFLKFL
jgi:mannose-1-phosphate guanylyltransferase